MQKPSPGPPAVLPEMTSLKTHLAVIKVMFGMLRFAANVRGGWWKIWEICLYPKEKNAKEAWWKHWTFPGELPLLDYKYYSYTLHTVSTPLNNISQLGLFPIYGKIKHVPNHQPEIYLTYPWRSLFAIMARVLPIVWCLSAPPGAGTVQSPMVLMWLSDLICAMA